MRYQELDTVVLDRDLPEHKLRKGDVGAIVELYEPDGIEVEFVRVSGVTLLEKSLKKSRPEYHDYIERTNAFFPWPPRRAQSSGRV